MRKKPVFVASRKSFVSGSMSSALMNGGCLAVSTSCVRAPSSPDEPQPLAATAAAQAARTSASASTSGARALKAGSRRRP